MENGTPFPLVDLLPCLGPRATENGIRKVGKEIVEAFQRTGYVFLNNHGLSVDYIKNFIAETDNFFDLEDEVKSKYKRSVETFHGYSTNDDEVIDPAISSESKTLRTIFDIQGLYGPFPDVEVPQMKKTTGNILDKLIPTVVDILRSLDFGLGMNAKTLVDNHQQMMTTGNMTDLRSIRYVCPEQEKQVYHLEAHIDFSTITLHLYGDLEGLELQDNDGVWQKPKLHPEYILLFPSEILQMWTGDKVKPARHRVMIPEDVECRKRSRHAVILFVHPDNHVVIEPFDGSKKHEPITALDFIIKRSKSFHTALYTDN